MTVDSLTDSTPTQPKEPTKPLKDASWSILNLFQLILGFIGIQFAWNTQIALSQQVLEPLGAGPFLYGLVWGVASLLGLIFLPIISRLSTDFKGSDWVKRKGLILSYGLVAAVGMVYFPQAPSLLTAGITLALVDVALHIAQGGYRSILPDALPHHQRPVAQSFLNFAFFLAPMIALSIFPLLQAFNMNITLTQQYLVAGIVLFILVFLGLQVINNKNSPLATTPTHPNPKPLAQLFWGIFSGFWVFAKASTAVKKLCVVQFMVWTGLMCLFIYFTPFVVHHIYELPDMSQATYKKEEALYQLAQKIETNVVTEANYKALSTVVTSVNKQKQQLIAPTIADITALNTQLDKALTPYFIGKTEAAFGVIKQLSAGKQLSMGISETERIIDLKLALLEFPLYEKKLDSQTESTTVETDQALDGFVTLPLLETLDKQEFYADTNKEASSTATLSLVGFNLVALLLTLPFTLLIKKWGKKRVLTLSLSCMAISFGLAPWIHTPEGVYYMMGGVGISWAAILSILFELLSDHTTNRDERAISEVFNRFMGMPQLIAALTLGQWIEHSPMQTALGMSHNWSLAFIVASVMVILGIIVLQTVKEN